MFDRFDICCHLFNRQAFTHSLPRETLIRPGADSMTVSRTGKDLQQNVLSDRIIADSTFWIFTVEASVTENRAYGGRHANRTDIASVENRKNIILIV